MSINEACGEFRTSEIVMEYFNKWLSLEVIMFFILVILLQSSAYNTRYLVKQLFSIPPPSPTINADIAHENNSLLSLNVNSIEHAKKKFKKGTILETCERTYHHSTEVIALSLFDVI